MSKGILLSVAGIWVVLQITKGGLLEHLGIST